MALAEGKSLPSSTTNSGRMSDTALAHREQGTALSRVLGTADVQSMLEETERNVTAIVDISRKKGYVRRYGDNEHEFFGFAAWQLLATVYGLVVVVEWTHKVDNGWEARAVVRDQSGDEVGSAEAMCTRQEGNRRNAPDHTLRAMAQTRANRNALRNSPLGAILNFVGVDFPDPDAPATTDQVAVLHILERELGFDGHAEAEVDSFKDLTREQASELIERWTALRDGSVGGREAGSQAPRHGTPAPSDDVEGTAVSSSLSGDPSDVGASEKARTGEGVTDSGASTLDVEEGGRVEQPSTSGTAAPATPSSTLDDLWKQAVEQGLTATKAKAVAKGLGFNVKSATELDVEQMQRVLKAAGKRR